MISWNLNFQRQAAWPHLFHGKGVQDVRLTTMFGRSRDVNRKQPKTQAAYSLGYLKQCQYLMIIKMQNVAYRFL